MIKSILLKLAHIINKHYKTIEIHNSDVIKYSGSYFKITRTSLECNYGGRDMLEINAISNSEYMKQVKCDY